MTRQRDFLSWKMIHPKCRLGQGCSWTDTSNVTPRKPAPRQLDGMRNNEGCSSSSISGSNAEPSLWLAPWSRQPRRSPSPFLEPEGTPWSLPWARWIQSILPNLISPSQILISTSNLRLCFPSDLFPSGFPLKILCAFTISPNSCYIPTHLPDNILWRIQIMDLLIVHFFSTTRVTSSPFGPNVRLTYHSILKHPQSAFTPPQKTTGKIVEINNLIFIFQTADEKTEYSEMCFTSQFAHFLIFIC